jgi:iron-sulfur cluster repair protein YtfE (RIC family)
MKRNRHLVMLSHDHYHGLSLANLIKKDAPVFKKLPNDLPGKLKYTLEMYDNDLVQHFADEEEILLPAIEGRDFETDTLIDEIIEEHCRIKDIVLNLRLGIDIEENLDLLGCMLEKHIRKEERILFKRIEEILNEDELKRLGMRISFSKTSKLI